MTGGRQGRGQARERAGVHDHGRAALWAVPEDLATVGAVAWQLACLADDAAGAGDWVSVTASKGAFSIERVGLGARATLSVVILLDLTDSALVYVLVGHGSSRGARW